MKKYSNLLLRLASVLALTIAAALPSFSAAQGDQQQAARSGTGFVYTADERGNSISEIDLSTGKVRTISIGISPHNIQASRDGRLLLVVGMVATAAGHSAGAEDHGEAGARGRLLILDTQALDEAQIADIEVGRDPAHVIFDNNDRLVYVTNAEDGTVSVVDVGQQRVIEEIETEDLPHGLRMSPDGREIYVANTGDDSVSVIDVATATVVSTIEVGEAPAQVAFTPDGQRVYVSSTTENSVVVVDAVERKSVATIPVGRKPIQVFSTPNGQYVYVANEGTKENPDNRVSVIDTTSNEVVATVEVGSGAHGVVVSDDGSRAFISNTVDSTVSIIDTTTDEVLLTLKVGDGSSGITFRSAGP